MKNWFIGGIATIVLAGGVSAQSDNREVPVENIDRLDAGGKFDLVYVPGDRASLRFEGDVDDIDDLDIDIRDGELEIRQTGGIRRWFGGYRNLDVTVYVTGPDVRSFSFSRGIDAELNELAIADIRLNVSTGASVDAQGTCDSADINISTGADLDGRDLVCGRVSVNASTGSDMSINAQDSLTASVSTGADVRSLTDPRDLRIRTSTGGDVHVNGRRGASRNDRHRDRGNRRADRHEDRHEGRHEGRVILQEG